MSETPGLFRLELQVYLGDEIYKSTLRILYIWATPRYCYLRCIKKNKTTGAVLVTRGFRESGSDSNHDHGRLATKQARAETII